MNKTVLVVDDDADVRECVESTLKDAGFDITLARDGRVALDLLRTGPAPAVILLDLMMPRVSGWDVLDHLRENPALDAIPVVVFTASQDPRESTLGKAVLRKPIEPALLVELIETLCNESARSFARIEESPSNLMPRPVFPE